MRFSLIIAAHNEGESLVKTVEGCVADCGGHDYEIILADDASWDGSVDQTLRRFPRVRVVRHDERRGASPTKNLGASNARGETLVFLDGHVLPQRGALLRMVEDVEQVKGQAVITPTVTALDERRWRSTSAQVGHGYFLELETFHCGWLPLHEMRAVQAGSRRFYESPAAIGCALAVDRELYEDLWGFDPQMRSWGVEDLDFSLKCALMGFRVLHDPEAVVAHRFRQAFDNFEVPPEDFIANQLRMARKNFTSAVWEQWVDRCRLRHPGQLSGHPEGLWARAWQVFEQQRPSVEQERAYLLARRTRDEFWYAQRFGLDWPRLQVSSDAMTRSPSRETSALSQPTARSEATAAVPSPSPIPPRPQPTPTPPCEVECCVCDVGCSTGPIRYANGEVQVAAVDLAAVGFGKPWQHRRVYSNQLSFDADLGNGFNWQVEQWPYLVEDFDGSLTVVRGTLNSLWFDLVDDQYVGRYGAKSSLEHDSGNHRFVLTLPSGDQLWFHDFDQADHPAGLFASEVTPGGQQTTATFYDAGNRIAEIEQSATVDSTTTTQSFRYLYDDNDRTISVTLRRQTGGGSWNDIRRVLYEYYQDSENFGSEGDLKRARIQVPNGGSWDDSDAHYYRYYTSGESGGFEHGLKYVVDPQAYARMVADSIDPLSASNQLIGEYARYHFQYDSQRRATLEKVDGGSRTYGFQYTASTHSDGYNHWKTKTVETRPDGSQWIVYTNYIGQVLVKELTDGSARWIEYHQYDGDGREIVRAEPSAVTGYNDSAADLDVSLKANDGLIHVTDYYATTTTGGAARGYRQFDKIKQGSDGSEVKLREYQYSSHTADGITVYPLSKQIDYRNDDGSGGVTTEFSFSYHGGTVAVQEQVTTLPAVPGSQNGANTVATRRKYFDIQGNLTWQMDERGYITHSKYDIPTGALVQRIEDVNTSATSGAPAGWTTPSGGGLNLVTDYQHDDLGRQTQSLGPQQTANIGGTATNIRRANWTVYRDAVHEVWSGHGYRNVTALTDTLINPVRIDKRDPRDNPLESIQAVRSSTAGKLLPSDSFPQSSFVRWTTHLYSDCCLLAAMRVFHDIPASGVGVQGSNYEETSYGYDLMKRRNRTVSQGGTIKTDVFDVRSQVIRSYVGTDDSDATATDPTGGGASGNNMVVMSENQYDGGSDGGDGNLTRLTQHVDAVTVRVTQYLYDWRNRQIATDGELDFFQQQFSDNLDRVVKTEQRDGSSSGQLLSRSATLYDDRGRVYRIIRYGVDPATGDITGDQIHDTTYDEAYNVLRQEPAGSMEFQTFEYDPLGRRVSATNPLDESTLYSFDDAGNQISTTDPNEEVWTRDYDPLGRLIRSTNPLDESTTYGFNDAGVQTAVTNALSETTTSTFDDAGRLIAVSDPLGQVTTYAYDANGNQVSLTDPNNLTTISEYDFRDRLIKVTDPLDDSTQYAYNRVGELIVETDAKDHHTTHVYDSLGRKVSTTDRLDQTTSFAWNPLGMQASLTDAQNQTTGYQYDEFARLHLTIWPDHQNGTQPGDQNYGITKTEYDSLNRVLRTTDQLGDTITHVYDAAGRLLAKDYRTLANSPSGTIADSDTFTYEATGRMLTAVSGRYSNTVTLAYDAAGRKSTESLTISGQTYTSATEYDAVGRVSKLIYPDASEVTRTHTARGQLATLASDATTIDTRVYDNGGRMVSSIYNNGVSESRTYNDDNTLASISYTGAAIGNLSYTWDANKNKMSETIGGVMSGYGFTAGYDTDDRLVSWDRADSALDQSWNLSPVGNWNSFTENATTQVRTHSLANEILTAATEDVFHDPKGNTTLIPPVLRTSTDPLKIKWDFDNKLRAADTNDDNTDDIFYKWDALGRRVGRDDGTSNVIYFQDGQQTLADYTAGTSSASPTYKYVFASYIDEIVARIDSSDDILYYHRNRQYSITALTDGGGSVVERYAYTAYGQATFADASGTVQSASASNNRYTYTGREWDQGLSLYHYRARMYDAVAGRFVGRDPIGFKGSKWNYYQYVGSRVLNHEDPSGLYGPMPGYGPGWDRSACCNKKTYDTRTHGCCGRKLIYNLKTECCEEGQVVGKVKIEVCRATLGGDYVPIPRIGYLSHTYIVCPDGKQYGKHPRPFTCLSDFLDMCGSGPGYVNEEVNRNKWRAKCKDRWVCPKEAKRMCKEGPTEEPYNLFCHPFGGTNCHSWGEGGSR